jgi:ABC-type nitrate/sulfonate/bicarbonate transport system ATPase subunit
MIRLEGICAGYGGNPIFNGLSLMIPDKGIAAVMGPSGCGKTTLLKLLAGLIKPSEGFIYGIKESKISMVFQEDRLLPEFTLFENVAAAGSARDAEKRLCEMELQDHFNDRPAELSGGMRRRAALARALCFNGDILLMDEPFKGMDDALKERIIGRIQKAAPLIIMATHDESDARAMRADTIIRL